MNKVILMGRLTRDPKVSYTAGENARCVARFTLAVDRRFKRDGDQTADFISCVAFGKTGEFAEKYAFKGKKFVVEGRIQTGSYEKDSQTIYTTDVIIEDMEFAESKGAEATNGTIVESKPNTTPTDDNWLDADVEGLPFNDLQV